MLLVSVTAGFCSVVGEIKIFRRHYLLQSLVIVFI